MIWSALSECIRVLFEETETLHTLFLDACENNNCELVDVCLLMKFVDPTIYRNC